jgi:hypothetical protein
MAILVKEPEGQYTPAPPGAHLSVCCDVVDLGMIETTWGSKPMVRIVWQIEERMNDERPFTVGKRYTASLHEKSRLRADLESWRGKRLSEEDLRGFDLERLIGVNALLNVIQEEKAGKVYSNITAIMPPPRSMAKIAVTREFVRRKDREDGGAMKPNANPAPTHQREPGSDDDPLGDALDEMDPFAVAV